jgi:hypothetical protein
MSAGVGLLRCSSTRQVCQLRGHSCAEAEGADRSNKQVETHTMLLEDMKSEPSRYGIRPLTLPRRIGRVALARPGEP